LETANGPNKTERPNRYEAECKCRPHLCHRFGRPVDRFGGKLLQPVKNAQLFYLQKNKFNFKDADFPAEPSVRCKTKHIISPLRRFTFCSGNLKVCAEQRRGSGGAPPWMGGERLLDNGIVFSCGALRGSQRDLPNCVARAVKIEETFTLAYKKLEIKSPCSSLRRFCI